MNENGNLLILVNGDKHKSYGIMTDQSYGDTWVEVIDHDNNERYTHGAGEFSNNIAAFDFVLKERILQSENYNPLPLTVKCFKAIDNAKIDISRAWVINDVGNGYFKVTTEIDGKSKETLREDEGLRLENADTTLSFVNFLERVYTECNSHVGEKTASTKDMYDKSSEILSKQFDARKLSLIKYDRYSDTEGVPLEESDRKLVLLINGADDKTSYVVGAYNSGVYIDIVHNDTGRCDNDGVPYSSLEEAFADVLYYRTQENTEKQQNLVVKAFRTIDADTIDTACEWSIEQKGIVYYVKTEKDENGGFVDVDREDTLDEYEALTFVKELEDYNPTKKQEPMPRQLLYSQSLDILAKTFDAKDYETSAEKQGKKDEIDR